MNVFDAIAEQFAPRLAQFETLSDAEKRQAISKLTREVGAELFEEGDLEGQNAMAALAEAFLTVKIPNPGFNRVAPELRKLFRDAMLRGVQMLTTALKEENLQ